VLLLAAFAWAAAAIHAVAAVPHFEEYTLFGAAFAVLAVAQAAWGVCSSTAGPAPGGWAREFSSASG
jgi:hypothetical protein